MKAYSDGSDGLLSVGRVKLAQIARDALLLPVFTTLNLLPSMATLAIVKRPIPRQSSTKRAQTLRKPRLLSSRKSAIVL